MKRAVKGLALQLADAFNVYPLFYRQTRYRATVFMMHHFCAAGAGAGGAVPADLLDRCLGYLAEHDYTVLALSEYVARLGEHAPFSKTVVFTVDDGYRDFYDCAYPVFVKYRMPAAVFLVTDFIDRGTPLWWDHVMDLVLHHDRDLLELKVGGTSLSYSLVSVDDRKRAGRELVEYCKRVPDEHRREIIGFLWQQSPGTMPPIRESTRPCSWAQVREMGRERIEFFPHTLTHPILARCESARVLLEVSESKRRVQEQTGMPAQIFCYPNGKQDDFDATVVAQLKASGYAAAVTTVPGHDDSRNAVDLFRLKRYDFPGSDAGFKQLVSGIEQFKDHWR